MEIEDLAEIVQIASQSTLRKSSMNPFCHAQIYISMCTDVMLSLANNSRSTSIQETARVVPLMGV